MSMRVWILFVIALHKVNCYSNLCKIKLGPTEQDILRCCTDYIPLEDSGLEHGLWICRKHSNDVARQVKTPGRPTMVVARQI